MPIYTQPYRIWVAEIENSVGYNFLHKYKCLIDFEAGEMLAQELIGSLYDDGEDNQSVCYCHIAFSQEFSIAPKNEAIMPAKFVDC